MAVQQGLAATLRVLFTGTSGAGRADALCLLERRPTVRTKSFVKAPWVKLRVHVTPSAPTRFEGTRAMRHPGTKPLAG
ncbi:hypothetical protein SNOG_13679 [Parastagonospora nodorum SN15]|uniref:Uncharacterized protein n=1 Tax=Phaeosphaeria nodorum (strain SN15 / ATCC MYA-4574 / FGSC 10173) TaxID=321614 RepID=Q0U3I5_PHANO|nr:hypothetical protein SNOG_13679 [Parastagonospora nodorum SN15]EAT79126.1 hypothetical protein SNOG_13679 [Parastagonospora nodorum SN15]